MGQTAYEFMRLQQQVFTINVVKEDNYNDTTRNEGEDDDDDTMIQVLIQPMNTTDRRTSRKFKDADPCYKFYRQDVANDTDLDFGDSDLSDRDKSGGYVDYDSLPNRSRRLSFEED